MDIFLTGASGYIGNVVAKTCARAGHRVVGLVRSQEAAKELQKHEIHPHIGDLKNPASYEAVAAKADVLIHCGYEGSQESVQRDFMTIETLIKTATYKPKTLIYTSGVWVYGNQDNPVDETATLAPLNIVKWRPPHETKVLGSHSSSLKPIVIRPGHVYGYGGGLVGMIFEAAFKNDLNIAGSGENLWSMIHVEDLSLLYVLAFEKGSAKVILNATDSQPVKVKEIVEGVSRFSGHQARFLSADASFKKFGPLAEGLMVNQHVVSRQATQMLSWRPRHDNFLKELENHWNTWKALKRN